MGNESPRAVCFLPSTMSTLSLTESVLSYFTCRTSTSDKSDQRKHGLIEDWQERLPSSSRRPRSQRDHSPSNSSSNRTNKSRISQPTSMVSSRSTACNDVAIVSRKKPAVKTHETYISSHDLDHDDDEEVERMAALSSPPKGKKRLSSSVSWLLLVLTIKNCP